MSVQLFVEGGGDGKALRTACRQGFRTLLEKAGLTGKMPSIAACGGRSAAYEDFKAAYTNGQEAMLLVDAEGPVATHDRPWQHLKARDGWDRPADAEDHLCHLMVQVMESWFLADPDALKSYYGQGFKPKSLHGNPNIEDVPKQDVFHRLKSATRDTKKGGYDKGSVSFELLAEIDPAKVRKASRYANRLIRALE